MKKKPNPHHYVFGELTDFLTGRRLFDTHDERYRQKIARWLVTRCGFSRDLIRKDVRVTLRAGEKTATVRADFLISHQGKTVMLIKYAPGSLVTRRQSNIALSRIITSYQIPIVAGTNGEDAEIIDPYTGKVLDSPLSGIPGIGRIRRMASGLCFYPVSSRRADQAARIVYAFEVDGACPCDTDICETD